MGTTNSLTFEFEDSYEPFSGFEEGNSTEDSDEFTCKESTDLKLFRSLLQTLVYSVVFLLGLSGNGLLLTVLVKRRGLLRIMEIYLLHLALADLLLLFTFPFALSQLAVGWVFGEFLCKLVGLLNRLNLLCGSLLLACIGFDRYLAIVHAVPSFQSRRPRTVHMICFVLWLLCLALSAPNAVFLSISELTTSPPQLSCSFQSLGIHSNNWLLTNRFLTHLLCFFLPLAVMCYCYTAVVVTLCHSQNKSLEKQCAIRLAIVITAVFCVCWLPFNLTMLASTLVDLGVISIENCNGRAKLDQALVMTESLGFTHCCLNPLLYAFVGVRFRSDLLQLFSGWGCRRICVLLLGTQGHPRSSFTERITSSTTVIV